MDTELILEGKMANMSSRVRILERRIARRRGGMVMIYHQADKWSINGRRYSSREELVEAEGIAGQKILEFHIRDDAPPIR